MICRCCGLFCSVNQPYIQISSASSRTLTSFNAFRRMDDTENTYIIRPDHKHKFRATLVQERVHSILADFFSDKEYNTELALEWSQQLADDIKSSLKELGLSRYKYVVQAVIGEQRGAGVKIASRCLWDCDTDQMAQETFMNDSLFCSVMVYGVYFY